MEFRSAVDRWYCLLLTSIPIAVLALIYPLVKADDPRGKLMLLLSSALAAGVSLWLTLSTRYTVTQDSLIARIGALRWVIPLQDITSVRRNWGLMRGPALAVRGLEIHYGRYDSILVSPREVDRFMKALGVGQRLQAWG